MYTVSNILGRSRVRGSFYESLDLDIPIEDLLENYNSCLLELSHVSRPEPFGLKLDDVIGLLTSSDRRLTISQWLVSIGNLALPTNDVPYVIKTEFVKQSDLLSTNFRIHYTDRAGNFSENSPDDSLTDVSLIRPEVDYAEIYNHCLFSVNGLLHIADSSTRGIFIQDAGTSIKKENKIQISTLSFYGLGTVETLPITRDMIHRGSENHYKNGFSIKLPYDITNKTVMLSIAGFLHYNKDCYSVTGEDSISIDWSKIPIADRFYDSFDKIDWSAFIEVCERSGMVDDLILTELSANEDEAILAILEMSQSFLILIDNNDLFYRHKYLEQTGLPGRYQSVTQPIGPIRTTNGFLHPYKVRSVAGLYWITMGLNWVQNRLSNKINRITTGIFRNGSVSQDPKYLSPGQEILIGKELVE